MFLDTVYRIGAVLLLIVCLGLGMAGLISRIEAEESAKNIVSDKPHESQVLKIARARAQIASGEIKLHTHFLVYDLHPDLVGGDWDIHYWFQSDRKVFRLDKMWTKSQDDGLPTASRFAYDGMSYKRIPKVGSLRIAVNEYVKDKPIALAELYDPRVLAIHPSDSMMLHNFSLHDVEKIVTNAVAWNREDTDVGFTETYRHNQELEFKYYFNGDGLLVRLRETEPLGGNARPGFDQILLDLKIEYDRTRLDRFQIPSRVDYKRYEASKLVLHEVMEIKFVQINQPIDRAVCTWAALGPKVGTSLFVDHDYDKPLLWNGAEFKRP